MIYNYTCDDSVYFGIGSGSNVTSDLLYKDLLYIPITLYNNTQIQDRIQSILKRQEKNLPTAVVAEFAHEPGLGRKEIEYFENQISQLKLEKKIYLFNISFYEIAVKQNLVKDEFCFVDYFAADIVSRFKRNTIKASSMSLYQRPSQLNFLAGKLNTRPSRILALYNLWKHKLTDDALIGIVDKLEYLLRQKDIVVDKEFWKFMEENIGSVDSPQISDNGSELLTNGYPYDVKIYDSTKISYIVETVGPEYGGPTQFITEKTFRPILNRSPFIIQGTKGNYRHLESLGFDTYNKFFSDMDFLVESYATDDTRYDYISKFPKHTKELLDAANRYDKELSTIALSNQKLLLDYGSKEIDKVRNFLYN
jgi:hypothetical protein